MTDPIESTRADVRTSTPDGGYDADRAAPVPVAALLDVLGVVGFVLLGRRSHDEGDGLSAVLEIAAPFLIALAVAWIGSRAWRRVTALAVAGTIAAVTVGLGLGLRRVAFERGIAFGFVVVTTIVLGGYLLAWRAVARLIARRRARHGG